MNSCACAVRPAAISAPPNRQTLVERITHSSLCCFGTRASAGPRASPPHPAASPPPAGMDNIPLRGRSGGGGPPRSSQQARVCCSQTAQPPRSAAHNPPSAAARLLAMSVTRSERGGLTGPGLSGRAGDADDAGVLEDVEPEQPVAGEV